jgi:glyoxylase-like metal-dependent hydrolase (beta-lactamase superfamily II)
MAEPIVLAPDVACLPTSIANVYFVGTREAWVLIDAGVIGYADRIAEAAVARFGADSKPGAIVLTHGHYDHAGCALELARKWNVPVYAHALEFPYLTGKSAYPRRDPTVGGAMGFLSRFFPSRTVNITEVLRELPADEVPWLPGWAPVHTPGHAPGHVCFWRAHDRTLLAGDVVATVNLDSWRGVVTQAPQISRPPSPFTYDWEQARASVRKIADLQPLILGCGHGVPMAGAQVAAQLEAFAKSFSPPTHGRYVETPARTDKDGIAYEPPAPPDKLPKLAAGLVAGVFLLAGMVYRKRGKKARQELV